MSNNSQISEIPRPKRILEEIFDVLEGLMTLFKYFQRRFPLMRFSRHCSQQESPQRLRQPTASSYLSSSYCVGRQRPARRGVSMLTRTSARSCHDDFEFLGEKKWDKWISNWRASGIASFVEVPLETNVATTMRLATIRRWAETLLWHRPVSTTSGCSSCRRRTSPFLKRGKTKEFA